MAAVQDNTYVPKDYEDLYLHYIAGEGSLTRNIVRKMMRHATDDEVEQLCQDVALRMIEKDMLTVFDPTKANFGGVVYFVTRTVVANHLDRKTRNPITGLSRGSIVNHELGDDDFEPGVYNLNRLFAAPTPDYASQIDARDVVSQLLSWADALAVHPQNKRDQCMRSLLDLMMEERDTKEIAKKLGVTVSTVFNWIRVLRERTTQLMPKPA